MSERQEFIDRFYFAHGRCCAGCDWWRSITALIGDCTKSAPVSGEERANMLGIEKCSMRFASGHIVTPRDHVCGEFKDDFDWRSLPLPYRRRVGAPTT
ncbi:hypothetical protein FJ551_25700 [Mesorhizobium sp. B2-5-1]|nr:hypothetical protein FJ551_25700 [Mesorhizobium sp. B2-5-1]TPL06712.1 hypothetical protein FJ944_23065 [Mesorhizobium sp. B2-4-11]